MIPRPQIHYPDVPFANSEDVTGDRDVELNLVEFGFCDRLHANGAPGNQVGQSVVALLDLRLVVRFDRSKIEAMLAKYRGHIVEMVREAYDLIAQSKEDQGGNLRVE